MRQLIQDSGSPADPTGQKPLACDHEVHSRTLRGDSFLGDSSLLALGNHLCHGQHFERYPIVVVLDGEEEPVVVARH